MDDVSKKVDYLESKLTNLENTLNLFLKSYSDKLEAEILEDKEKEEISTDYLNDWNSVSTGVNTGYIGGWTTNKLDSTAPVGNSETNYLLRIYMETVVKLLG